MFRRKSSLEGGFAFKRNMPPEHATGVLASSRGKLELAKGTVASFRGKLELATEACHGQFCENR